MYQKKSVSHKRAFSSSHDFCHLFENNQIQLDMWCVGTVFKLAWHGKSKHLPWDILHFYFSIFPLCLFLPFKHNIAWHENIKKNWSRQCASETGPLVNLKNSKKRESGRNWLNENSIAKGKRILMAQICRVVSYTILYPCNRISWRDTLSRPWSLSPSSLTSEIPVTSDSCGSMCNAVQFQSVDRTTRVKAI